MSAMDLSFIVRTLKTTGILALIVLAFGWMYYDIFDVLAVFSGMIWGIVNFYFLTHLVRTVITPEGVDKIAAFGFMFIKFPLLYLAGYFLIKNPHFDTILLVFGFSSILAVMVLKVLSRVILGLDNKDSLDKQYQQEAH